MLIHDKPTLYVLFCKHLLPSNYDSIQKKARQTNHDPNDPLLWHNFQKKKNYVES